MAEDNFAMGYALGQDSNGGNCNNGKGSWGEMIFAIIILAMFAGGDGFGNGGGLFGGGRGNGAAATQAEIQRGFDTQSVISKLDGINNGICSLGYDQLAQMNNLGMAIANQGYQNAQLANGITQNITQARFDNQQCCCETNRNIDSVRFENAKNTCDIIQAGNANTQRIIDTLTQNTIQDLRDKATTYELQLSQQAQTANGQHNDFLFSYILHILFLSGTERIRNHPHCNEKL